MRKSTCKGRYGVGAEAGTGAGGGAATKNKHNKCIRLYN